MSYLQPNDEYNNPRSKLLHYREKTYISIITTHQARLRCLLSKIFNKPMKRFKNGCVLKMEVTRLTITFELVYSGEVSKIKPGYEYYISPNDTQVNGTILFDIEEFTIPNNFYNLGDNERFIFYLIRHGEASHNVKKGLSKMFQSISGEKDTSLTPEGVEQARQIYGNIVESERNLINPDILYLFSSDLKRTRETMVNFISQLRRSHDRIIITDLIVLPCAHELNYKKDGNCDGRQFLTANENIMNCDGSRPECRTEGDYKVNWGLYETFYDGTRTKSGRGKQQCRNTDMIKQAIEYIKTNAPDVEDRFHASLDPPLYSEEDGGIRNSDPVSDPDSDFRGYDDESTEDELKYGGRGKRRRLQTKRNRNNKKTKREIIKKNKKTRKQKNKKTRKQRKQRKQRK
jgi:broad specificity phosphatase PhoE